MAATLLMTACGGGDTDPTDGSAEAQTPNAESAATPGETDATVVDVEPTVQAAPTSEPAPPTEQPTVVVEVTDQERIDAAKLMFEADLALDYESFDYLTEAVDGVYVDVTVCAWTGETIYDEVLGVRYETTSGGAGVDTALIGTTTPNQDCVNSGLVESALEFIDEHDQYWTAILQDPTTYDPTVGAPDVLTPGLLELRSERVAGWVDDGVHWREQTHRGDPRESGLFGPLWRRYESPIGPVFGVAACRDMLDGYGLYRDDLLLDDFATGIDPLGPHSITEYIMVRSDNEWRMSGVEGLVWANCLGAGEWVTGANSWRPDPVLWREVPA